MAEFKDMLVYYRKKYGMSQAELGRKVGVAPTTIASYEQGKRHPSFEIEEAIADVFNVNLDTLRGKTSYADISYLLNDESIEMLKLFSHLGNDGKHTALQHLKFLETQEKEPSDDLKDC